jgi:hypothetical protein
LLPSIITRRKVLQSFSGAETAASEDDEAAGLSPGNEENETGGYFSPEKPCLPLLIEGVFVQKKKCPSAVRHWQSDI